MVDQVSEDVVVCSSGAHQNSCAAHARAGDVVHVVNHVSNRADMGSVIIDSDSCQVRSNNFKSLNVDVITTIFPNELGWWIGTQMDGRTMRGG